MAFTLYGKWRVPTMTAARASVSALALSACLSLCLATSLTAQQNARNLTGIVTDGHHEPLSGAVVQVHSEALGTVVSYITGRSGQYSFKRLQGDLDYDVFGDLAGPSFRDQKDQSLR